MFRNRSAVMTVALSAVLVLPAAAQADPGSSASASVQAAARAELNLNQATQAAATAGRGAQRRARALMRRSRSELTRAATDAQHMLAEAQSSSQVTSASATATALSSALAQDSQGQVALLTHGAGGWSGSASGALQGDLGLQQGVLSATLALEGSSASPSQVAGAAQAELHDLANEVQAAVTAAQQSPAGSQARTTFELGVASASQAVSQDETVAAQMQGAANESTQSELAALQQRLAGVAQAIASSVEGVGVSGDQVDLAGHGTMTLGSIVSMNAQGGGSTSTSAAGTGDGGAPSASAGVTAQGSVG